MSTNFYIHKNCCNYCNRFDKVHVGKAARGWNFQIANDNFPDFEGLVTALAQNKDSIFNENGELVSFEDMVAIIAARTHYCSAWLKGPWLEENDAEPGLNGLARHKENFPGLVKHGKGTYDFFSGNFS